MLNSSLRLQGKKKKKTLMSHQVIEAPDKRHQQKPAKCDAALMIRGSPCYDSFFSWLTNQTPGPMMQAAAQSSQLNRRLCQ